MMRLARLAIVGSAVVAGCSSTSISGTTGAVAGVASGAVTANPAVGYAIGISVQAATDATVKYVFRSWKDDQQNVMANIAGQLPLAEAVPWEIRHRIPYDNEHGLIQVIRDIDTPIATCREVAFTVDKDGQATPPYTAAICRQSDQWKWAVAEPAVTRWQGLQ